MAHILAVALSMVIQPAPMTGAPMEGPDAKYCMRVEPVTGSRVEYVRCWTRAEWVDQGVDVDREWAREGVAILR